MKTTAELLGELMAAAYNCKKHDIFVDYDPHVQEIYVSIYMNGWKMHKCRDENHQFYLDDEMANEKLKAIIGYIKHLSKE